MGRRRDYDDYNGRDNGGTAYAIATAIKWIGVVVVTVIIAYVVLRLTGTIEGIIFSAPRGTPSASGVSSFSVVQSSADA